MIRDLILIGCIIVASFIFKLSTTSKNNNLFDPQMMFILLTLGIVIIHKVFYMRKINKKEGFQINNSGVNDLANEFLNFTSGQEHDNVVDKVASMSEAARKEYLTHMSNISNQVSELNDNLNEIKGESLGGSSINSSHTHQKIDLNTMQQMQELQIKNLQEAVDRHRSELQQQEIEENSRKYKPIKVYSSCAVSSADGAFTEDTFNDTPVDNSLESANNPVNSEANKIMQKTITQNTGNTNQLAKGITDFLKDLNQRNIHIH